MSTGSNANGSHKSREPFMLSSASRSMGSWAPSWVAPRFPPVVHAAEVPPSKPAMIPCDREDDGSYAMLRLPGGAEFRFPVLRGSAGPPVVDIRSLYTETGYFAFDPGFMSTSSCYSSITFIDGNEGKLLYRGYPIEVLAEKSDFMDVAYLLFYGELPDVVQREKHIASTNNHTMVHEKLIQFFSGFKSDAHPMAIMVGVVGALSAFYHDSLDIHNADHRSRAAYRLLAKMPTLAAMAFKSSIGQPYVYPRNDLSYAENLLYMMFAVPSQSYELNPVLVRAMNVWLILHADHEQNASTSTVRIAGSSSANPYACIASGITTLWGPAHGGANEAVIRMLEQIGTVENIPKYLNRAKDKSDNFRLMGFGHRVYKNFDPRSLIMRKVCYEVLEELGIENDTLLQLSLKLENAALSDDYFVSRKLYPNVDFYSGIMLKAMGIPISMFTVLFAVARSVGWITNWREMIEDPAQKIGRPRQLYVGQREREFKSIEDRPLSEESKQEFKKFEQVTSKPSKVVRSVSVHIKPPGR